MASPSEGSLRLGSSLTVFFRHTRAIPRHQGARVALHGSQLPPLHASGKVVSIYSHYIRGDERTCQGSLTCVVLRTTRALDCAISISMSLGMLKTSRLPRDSHTATGGLANRSLLAGVGGGRRALPCSSAAMCISDGRAPTVCSTCAMNARKASHESKCVNGSVGGQRRVLAGLWCHLGSCHGVRNARCASRQLIPGRVRQKPTEQS
jgi:hypothetical protein